MEARAREADEGGQPAAQDHMGLLDFTVHLTRAVAHQGAQILNWMAEYGVPVVEEPEPPIAIAIVEDDEPVGAVGALRVRAAGAVDALRVRTTGAVDALRARVLRAPLTAFCFFFVCVLGLGVGVGMWASNPGHALVVVPLDAAVTGVTDLMRIGGDSAYAARSRRSFSDFFVHKFRKTAEGNNSTGNNAHKVAIVVLYTTANPLKEKARAPGVSAGNTEMAIDLIKSLDNVDDSRTSFGQLYDTFEVEEPKKAPARATWKFWRSGETSLGEDLASGPWV